MLNGIFSNPTAIYFGRGMEDRVGEEVAKYATRILLHYGTGSFKISGLYDKVLASLVSAGVSIIELGGVRPNPSADLVYRGIELCRNNDIEFILAVGGGSVIDSAKAISIGVPWTGDFFDFFEGKNIPGSSLKVATILTSPGSGSESSMAAVITHDAKNLKLTCANQVMAPVFSILNPELTYTLSNHQTSCGIVDAVTHVMERYFTNTTFVESTDWICEGLIRTLMKYAIIVKDAPHNYDVRAEIMWAAKLAHDNTAGFGRKQDWSSHSIAHELGAIYNVIHGEAVGVIIPGWMKHVYRNNIDRFTQFARRVFDIEPDHDNPEASILLAIDKFKEFLEIIGMPVTFQGMGIHEKTRFDEVARKCVMFMPSGTIGNFVRLQPKDIANILDAIF